MSSSIIVRASKPRRGRKPLPHKPEPACGPIVRQVRGVRAFDKIAEGLGEALAIARSEAQPARVHGPPDVFEQLKASLRSKG